MSGWLYEVLSPHVGELVVAGVSESAGSKNDRLDAFARAEQLRIGAIGTKVYKSAGPFARLRHLAKAYAALVSDSVRVQNRIKSLLHARGVAANGGGVYAVGSREEWLARLRRVPRGRVVSAAPMAWSVLFDIIHHGGQISTSASDGLDGRRSTAPAATSREQRAAIAATGTERRRSINR